MSALEFPERPEGVPERRPGADRPWAAIWAIPIALAALVAGGLTYAVAAAIRGSLVDAPVHQAGEFGVALHGTPPLLTLAGTLAQDLALVLGAVLVAAAALGGRVTGAHFGLRPARVWSSVGFVVACYVAFILISAGWVTALGIKDRQNLVVELGTQDSVLALVAAGFLSCIMAPICEELFFRGFLFGALRKHGLLVATAVSGVAFGLAHVASSPIGFIVPLAALGILMALLYERTGSLYPPMGLHALNNSIAFGVGDGRLWLIPVALAASGLCVYALARAVGARDRSRAVAASP